MSASKFLLPAAIALTLAGPAGAEVYQSKDAQGNTVFSDRPSAGAEAVEVSPTNSADPVVERPRPTPTPDTSAIPRKKSAKSGNPDEQQTDDDYFYYGDDYDYENIDDRVRREKRRDAAEERPPRTDRPVVTPHRKVSRPASGGAGRR